MNCVRLEKIDIGMNTICNDQYHDSFVQSASEYHRLESNNESMMCVECPLLLHLETHKSSSSIVLKRVLFLAVVSGRANLDFTEW